MPTQLLLKNCRLGYPVLFEAKPVMKGNKPMGDRRTFRVNAHLAPGAEEEIKKAIAAEIQETWPDKTKRPYIGVGKEAETWFNKNHRTGQERGGLRLPLVWGPSEWPDDAFAKGWVLICSSPEGSPPAIVERVGGINQKVTDPTKVYPGCEAHVYVNIKYYESGEGGIAGFVSGVMLTNRETERWDGRPSVDQMFDGIGDDEVAEAKPSAGNEADVWGDEDAFGDSSGTGGSPPATGSSADNWDDDILF